MNADMLSNKKRDYDSNWISNWCRKLNISDDFITQSYFKVPKDVRITNTHFFIKKILNKQIA